NDLRITNDLLANLKGESERVCPLSCARGEHPEGDRCVANAKPEKQEKPEKSEQAQKSQKNEKSKTAARPKHEEPRREARPKREEPRREAARPAPAPLPAPAARTQASSSPGRASGMIGVGF